MFFNADIGTVPLSKTAVRYLQNYVSTQICHKFLISLHQRRRAASLVHNLRGKIVSLRHGSIVFRGICAHPRITVSSSYKSAELYTENSTPASRTPRAVREIISFCASAGADKEIVTISVYCVYFSIKIPADLVSKSGGYCNYTR